MLLCTRSNLSKTKANKLTVNGASQACREAHHPHDGDYPAVADGNVRKAVRGRVAHVVSACLEEYGALVVCGQEGVLYGRIDYQAHPLSLSLSLFCSRM